MKLIHKDFGEHEMYLLAKDRGISKTLAKPGGYKKREIEFMTLIREQLKPGEVAFDIGANIGYVSLVMAMLVGERGHIYAVEPDSTNFKVLTKNVALNKYESRFTLERLGISDMVGNLTFHRSKRSNLGSFEKIHKDCPGTEDTPVVTLDEYLKDKDELPTFYKMDVEGHEVKVIRGMRETAKRSLSGTKVLIEVHPQFFGPDLHFEPELRAMVDIGFRFKYVISAAIAQPKLFKERGYSPKRVYESSGWYRGVYDDISTEDAIYFCSNAHHEYVPRRGKSTKKIVRAIMLEKE